MKRDKIEKNKSKKLQIGKYKKQKNKGNTKGVMKMEKRECSIEKKRLGKIPFKGQEKLHD